MALVGSCQSRACSNTPKLAQQPKVMVLGDSSRGPGSLRVPRLEGLQFKGQAAGQVFAQMVPGQAEEGQAEVFSSVNISSYVG